ncbi:hypothetical protein [Qipengyuania sphaerica]|uniref:hypothetical protein n=1 Tax=Qipengyuania sphaerica TaxID=2867243 RepID=UPI001C86F0BD|nr:hypothetical protein [Qipengyuania sphaerica]MBX7540876.1 hypothetical protein [Qipengyuania sphaerica]
MKKMMTALAAFTLVTTMSACTKTEDTEATAEAGSIAGDWLIDLDSAQFENDNRDFVLADGKWECNSCTPPYSVTADGEWQEIDRPGADSQMIEIVDDRTVKTATRLGDKDLGNATWTVSEDGQTMKVAFTDLSGDTPVNASQSFNRTEAGPDGSHALSGKWSVGDMAEMDDAGLRFSYGLDGNTFTSTGNGRSWTAELGGEPVPIEGNNSNVMAAIERTGDNTYRQTFTRDGETLSTTDITIDGDTMNGVSTDARDDSVVRWSATRQ